MPNKRDAIAEFILAREGEVHSLHEIIDTLDKRKKDQNQNTHIKKIEATAILSALNRMTNKIDMALFAVDIKNPENIVNNLFGVISEIRNSINVEISNVSRDYGFNQGNSSNTESLESMLREKITAVESTVQHQKTLLEKSASGVDIYKRPIGEKPIPTKAKRAFEKIVKEEEHNKEGE
ncbi:hypothetical protein OAA09_00790 [bacterium]|nr:hypothetical protein [bacterium]